jgi:hypothetical protein
MNDQVKMTEQDQLRAIAEICGYEYCEQILAITLRNLHTAAKRNGAVDWE